MAMAAAPSDIDPVEVRAFLAGRAGVESVHDLHIWPMSTTEVALTCHLVMPEGHPGDAFLHQLAEDLAKRFRIAHSTVQIEVDPDAACALAPGRGRLIVGEGPCVESSPPTAEKRATALSSMMRFREIASCLRIFDSAREEPASAFSRPRSSRAGPRRARGLCRPCRCWT